MPKKAAKSIKNKEPRFEQLFERLETIVNQLEDGDIELEEALNAFEEGMKLSQALNERLNQAQEKVELLIKNTQGEIEAAPLNRSSFRDEGEEDAGI